MFQTDTIRDSWFEYWNDRSSALALSCHTDWQMEFMEQLRRFQFQIDPIYFQVTTSNSISSLFKQERQQKQQQRLSKGFSSSSINGNYVVELPSISAEAMKSSLWILFNITRYINILPLPANFLFYSLVVWTTTHWKTWPECDFESHRATVTFSFNVLIISDCIRVCLCLKDTQKEWLNILIVQLLCLLTGLSLNGFLLFAFRANWAKWKDFHWWLNILEIVI